MRKATALLLPLCIVTSTTYLYHQKALHVRMNTFHWQITMVKDKTPKQNPASKLSLIINNIFL